MSSLSVALATLPNVFVSSTVLDMGDLRAGIKYVLEQQGFRVLLSEQPDFDVRGDRPAVEECLENVRVSDYFVLIIGGRRGGIYQDEGISVTRKEYRVAREQFIRTGKPRILLYIPLKISLVMNADLRIKRAAGIDYIRHLSSFVGEVTNPHCPGVESFLTRFSGFADLMSSLSGRINFGRNVAETLIRRSLVSELSGNLAKMCRRFGHSAYPHHMVMREVVDDVAIDGDNLTGETFIAGDQRSRLLYAMPGAVRATDLKTTVIEDALNNGTFLELNPSTEWPVESEIHMELQNALDFIGQLRLVDGPFDNSGWPGKLNLAVIDDRRWDHGCNVNSFDLALAFTYHNRITNVFNNHVALCRVLLGLVQDIPIYERRPVTYRGHQEERRIQAEHVSPSEVQRLITSDIFPFGARAVITDFGQTREEQIGTFAAVLRQQFPSLDDGSINEIAARGVDSFSAQVDEGIEDLPI
ncbi:MAG: DUF4062 domain-containing protein [Chloroflexi bacterium]|nr:DUF4062 domain-containing protein [Chloroflexota bacterium]